MQVGLTLEYEHLNSSHRVPLWAFKCLPPTWVIHQKCSVAFVTMSPSPTPSPLPPPSITSLSSITIWARSPADAVDSFRYHIGLYRRDVCLSSDVAMRIYPFSYGVIHKSVCIRWSIQTCWVSNIKVYWWCLQETLRQSNHARLNQFHNFIFFTQCHWCAG